MRKQIAAANWKMNLTLLQGEQLAEEILSAGIKLSSGQQAIFAVPFPYLAAISRKTAVVNGFYTAAQNCAAESSGAYTGEVSAAMLAGIEIPYVIIGHSERREYYGETNEVLAKKIDLALENKLKPIFCCGEPLEVREGEKQNSHIAHQLRSGLFHLDKVQMSNFVIAYEPVWAIGTGRTATSEQVQEMHQHIRKVISTEYDKETGDSVSILYGGSVKASNAAGIFSQPDVDGGLVGGASLIAAEFITIIKSLKK